MDLAIETHGLSKTFKGFHAVDAIDLRVRPGEIYGFLGLNGAGKTTTIRALPHSYAVVVLACRRDRGHLRLVARRRPDPLGNFLSPTKMPRRQAPGHPWGNKASA